MVKECKVTINNDHVTVVKYDDGEYVQLPSIKKKADTIMVKFHNGAYIVVDDCKPHSQNHTTVTNEIINDQSDKEKGKRSINSQNDKSNIVLIEENDIEENNQN